MPAIQRGTRSGQCNRLRSHQASTSDWPPEYKGPFADLGSVETPTLHSRPFAELGPVQALQLSSNRLTALPPGTFSGLSGLSVLHLRDKLGSTSGLTLWWEATHRGRKYRRYQKPTAMVTIIAGMPGEGTLTVSSDSVELIGATELPITVRSPSDGTTLRIRVFLEGALE